MSMPTDTDLGRYPSPAPPDPDPQPAYTDAAGGPSPAAELRLVLREAVTLRRLRQRDPSGMLRELEPQ